MRAWCILAGVLLFAGTAGAATVQRLTLGQLAERSERVFIGTVAAQRAEAEIAPVRVWTYTRFSVEETLKGPKSRDFTLRQLGGDAGRWVQKVPGYATFAPGERVMLFLERTQTGRLVVTGLAQGKFTLRTDAKSGLVTAERNLAGLGFPGPAPRTLTGQPTDPNRMKLRDLVAIVRGGKPVPAPLVIERTPQRRLPAGGSR